MESFALLKSYAMNARAIGLLGLLDYEAIRVIGLLGLLDFCGYETTCACRLKLWTMDVRKPGSGTRIIVEAPRANKKQLAVF